MRMAQLYAMVGTCNNEAAGSYAIGSTMLTRDAQPRKCHSTSPVLNFANRRLRVTRTGDFEIR